MGVCFDTTDLNLIRVEVELILIQRMSVKELS